MRSSGDSPFHLRSLLKYKTFSPCYSRLSIFPRETTNFLRHVHRGLLFRYSRSETGSIAGHSRPRAITNNLYITNDLSACQNSDHRGRAEQFAHRNDNPHAGQKDGGRLLIVRILSAADVAERTSFLEGNRAISKRWKLLDCVFWKYPSSSIILSGGLLHEHMGLLKSFSSLTAKARYFYCQKF